MPVAANIYYFEHMPEEHVSKRPPVILIHGAGGNHLSWPPQIRRLPAQRVLAIDLPGHGKSEGVGRQTIDDYSDDVFAFMKALRLRAAVLVGISMGGAIGLSLALKYPKKIAALGLIGSSAKLRVTPAILDSLANPAVFSQAVHNINDDCFSAAVLPQVKDVSRQAMLETRPAVLLGDFLACNSFDVTDRVMQIKCPSIIVCGSDDKMAPLKLSELLQELIEGTTMHILQGVGHMVMVEQPQPVAALLSDFLNGLAAYA